MNEFSHNKGRGDRSLNHYTIATMYCIIRLYFA